MIEPLRNWVHGGKPTWGTCAGMILLAERATGQKQGGQALIGGLHATVNRNYFGRQVDGFEADLEVTVFDDVPFHAVFIRAPAITAIDADVEPLAYLMLATPGAERVIVAARQGPILATHFTVRPTIQRIQVFLDMVRQSPNKHRFSQRPAALQAEPAPGGSVDIRLCTRRKKCPIAIAMGHFS
ncbi:MAG: hypothetical protein R2856_17145 [Caldilineaceae bacterium]